MVSSVPELSDDNQGDIVLLLKVQFIAQLVCDHYSLLAVLTLGAQCMFASVAVSGNFIDVLRERDRIEDFEAARLCAF